MVTRYDVISSKWSSHFWVKMHVFSTFFNNKSKTCGWKDAKCLFMCYFTCQAQHITISSGFNLMAGGIITHSSLLVICSLSNLTKSPNQCCKLSPKSPEGSGQYDIYIYIFTWLILGKILNGGQDDHHCWWRHRPPAAPPPIKYTSPC